MFRRAIRICSVAMGGAMIAAAPAMHAQENAAAAAAAAPIAAVEGETQGLQAALSKLIPEGKNSLNVTIPNLVNGILKTIIKAASIRRMGDADLEMVALVIEMYDEEGVSELAINMETAQLNLPTGILVSDRPTQISNKRFDLIGDDGLVYDLNTQKGRLPGRVTMYVYKAEDISREEPSPEKSDKKEHAENE